MNRAWLTGVALLGIAVVIAAFVQLSVSAGRGGEAMPLYSNQRFDPYGTAALYRVMELRADTVLSLERPRLSDEHRGVLLQVLPVNDQPAFDYAGNEIDNPYLLPTSMLLDWVAQGNTLIQMTRSRTRMMETMGVDFADSSVSIVGDSDDWAVDIQNQQTRGVAPDELDVWPIVARWDASDHANGSDSPQILLNAPRAFALEGPDGWRPNLLQGREAFGGEMPHGEGRIIFVGSPSPALNHYLASEDNLIWLVDLLGDETVVFDEWAHGVGHGGTILETLLHFGLLPFLLQVPVWLVFYRWASSGRRFALDSELARRRSTQQQIDTLSRLYDQAWDGSQKARGVYDEVMTRFSRACRCEKAVLEARLSARDDEAAKRGLAIISEARALATAVHPRCMVCDYDLVGVKAERCPECGTPIPLRLRRLIQTQAFTDASPSRKQKVRSNESALIRILNESSALTMELKRV